MARKTARKAKRAGAKKPVNKTPAKSPPASKAPAKGPPAKEAGATRSARRTKAQPKSATAKARPKGPRKAAPARRHILTSARRAKAAAPRSARARVAARPRGVKRPRSAPRVEGVAIKGKLGARYTEVLTPPALRFLADLHREFEAARERLLAARAEQQARHDPGELPDFGPGPADLRDRGVETTGPIDRKGIVNALNAAAGVVIMADFAGVASPTWSNNIEGQIDLKDRWAGKLGDKVAALIVRPRGWHLIEEHLTVDGEAISASLFDFGLAFFHSAKAQVAAGTRPCFHLPGLETPTEGQLWNEVFAFAQERYGMPEGTIRASADIDQLLEQIQK